MSSFPELSADTVIDNGQLSLAYRDLSSSGIVESLLSDPRLPSVTHLDLTESNIIEERLVQLKSFPNIQTLVLDQNNLISISPCPALSSLHTLWLNNNNIDDLPKLLDDISAKFPNIKYLSLMRNPCCPGLMNVVSPDEEGNRLYRLYVFYRLPNLLTLDWADGTETVITRAICPKVMLLFVDFCV